MKTSTFIASQSVIWFVAALGLVVWPEGLVSIFGPALTPLGYVVARIFGAELMGLALASWLTRRPRDSGIERGLCVAYVVSNALGFAASLRGTLSGALNQLGWALVAVYLIYALGFAWYLARKPEAGSAVAQ